MFFPASFQYQLKDHGKENAGFSNKHTGLEETLNQVNTSSFSIKLQAMPSVEPKLARLPNIILFDLNSRR